MPLGGVYNIMNLTKLHAIILYKSTSQVRACFQIDFAQVHRFLPASVDITAPLGYLLKPLLEIEKDYLFK